MRLQVGTGGIKALTLSGGSGGAGGRGAPMSMDQILGVLVTKVRTTAWLYMCACAFDENTCAHCSSCAWSCSCVHIHTYVSLRVFGGSCACQQASPCVFSMMSLYNGILLQQIGNK